MKRFKSYRMDPRIIEARFDSTCKETGKSIRKVRIAFIILKRGPSIIWKAKRPMILRDGKRMFLC